MDRQVIEVSSLSLSFYLFPWLSTYLPTYLSMYHLSLSLSVCVPVYLSVYLSICLSVYLSSSLKTKRFCETSSIFKLDNIKNAAILRDFLTFLHLTTSKTDQFCKTSSFFWVDNIKNEAIRRDIFKNGKLSAELTAWYQCVLRFFQSICLNYCACHEQVMPGHTKCCTCHAKSPQQTWRSEAPKCNSSQEISARTS